jgi:hypothetical protein
MGLLQKKDDMLEVHNTILRIETSIARLSNDNRVIKKNIKLLNKKIKELSVVNDILLSVQQSILDEFTVENPLDRIAVFPLTADDDDDDLPN